MGENVLHSWQSPVDVPYMIIGGAPEATVFFREKFTRVFPGRITTTTAKESALIAASTDAGYDPGFLRSISAANDRFRSTCAECGGGGSGTTFGGCASCGVIGALR
jgi:hypothetical protein